ncbi:hypothetical protein [Simkania sp.]|uniref:hypothetical protein n=1 Tax=Simkania sp. TaxID=34094 RepID=UPI003B5224AB
MRSGNVLFSAVHFFVILLILSLGGLLLALPYAETFRFHLTYYIYERPGLFKLIGGVTLGFGLLLFLGFYFLNKRRFLTVRMGPAMTQIDERVVQDYVQDYFKEKHTSDEGVVDVVVQKGEVLEIIVPAPKDWEGEVEEHLQRLQNDLGDRLSRRLGYYKEFYLTLSDN